MSGSSRPATREADDALRLLDELDPSSGSGQVPGTGGDGAYYPNDPPTDQGPPSGDGSYYPDDPPTDQGPATAPDVCVSWIVYEVYATGGAGACPQCAPFVGNEYQAGDGPLPPLHYGCDCYRVASRWECYSAAGVLLDAGYY